MHSSYLFGFSFWPRKCCWLFGVGFENIAWFWSYNMRPEYWEFETDFFSLKCNMKFHDSTWNLIEQHEISGQKKRFEDAMWCLCELLCSQECWFFKSKVLADLCSGVCTTQYSALRSSFLSSVCMTEFLWLSWSFLRSVYLSVPWF